MKVKDKTALITGAGGGIGRGIALALARRGCNLFLTDVNDAGLTETEKLAGEYGIKVTKSVLDVTDQAAVESLKESMESGGQTLDILVNNAGIAHGGTFEQVTAEDFDRVMEVNFHAIVRITRTFLPMLQQRESARIVNISSLFGIISPPEQTAYCASKFALRGFSNALRFELEDGPVGVTVVHPGGVATNIARDALIPPDSPADEVEAKQKMMEKLLRMPAEKAGEKIVRGILRNKARVLVGSDAKVISLLERMLPVSYWKLLKVLKSE